MLVPQRQWQAEAVDAEEEELVHQEVHLQEVAKAASRPQAQHLTMLESLLRKSQSPRATLEAALSQKPYRNAELTKCLPACYQDT